MSEPDTVKADALASGFVYAKEHAQYYCTHADLLKFIRRIRNCVLDEVTVDIQRIGSDWAEDGATQKMFACHYLEDWFIKKKVTP